MPDAQLTDGAINVAYANNSIVTSQHNLLLEIKSNFMAILLASIALISHAQCQLQCKQILQKERPWQSSKQPYCLKKNQISGSQAESKWHKLKEEQQRKLPKEVSILQSSTSNVPETTALLTMIRKNIESILQPLQSEMALLAMILKKYWKHIMAVLKSEMSY